MLPGSDPDQIGHRSADNHTANRSFHPICPLSHGTPPAEPGPYISQWNLGPHSVPQPGAGLPKQDQNGRCDGQEPNSRQDNGQVSVGSNFARGRPVLASPFWQILWPADTEYSSASLLYTSVSGRLSICFGSEASDRGNGTVRAALFDLPLTFVQWSDAVVRHAPDPEGIAH
jgi:hypothetical protein